jgi:dTDP-glucose 4,6-dehydratase
MRVLITGAGGFMGSHVLRHLLINTDWDIVLIDSFRHKGKTDRISVQTQGLNDAAKRVTVITHDLVAPISEQMAGRIGQIDYVLNIASESHVDRSISEPRSFIENNVQLVLTMLDYIRQYPVKKFIQISTDEVYGPAPNDHAHTEGEPHRPSNPYSASKAAQEDICYAYWRTYDLPICITNTMNIIGELQDPEKFIPMTIRRVLTGGIVPIHASADGETIGSRYYLHARNQADALLHLLNNVDFPPYSSDNPIAHYHIVGERECTNLEVATMIAECLDKPLEYKLVDFHSSRPGHDLRYALNGEKIAATGWQAPLSFADSLNVTVNWSVRHKEWLE